MSNNKIIEWGLESRSETAVTIRGRKWTRVMNRAGELRATSLKQAKEKLAENQRGFPYLEFRITKITIEIEVLK